MRKIPTIAGCMITLVAVHSATAEDLAFQLPGIDGKQVALGRDSVDRFTVVCFLGTECPMVQSYAASLSKMSGKYAESGIRFIGIDSNVQDSMEELRDFAKRLQVPFALAKDHGNVVADRYSAKRTPEVFVLDRELNVRYRGRIDDQYQPGVSRSMARNEFLRDAIDQLLNGDPVTLPETEASGCLIGRVKETASKPTVTWTNQISRIVQQHCLECHRDGEIGPFALEDYEQATGWAEMMVEVVDNGRMPPWHATAEHAEFSNERFLSDREKQLLRQWLKQGTPYGETEQLPPPKQFVSGWRLPKDPEVVTEMRKQPFRVPATGTVEYQYFVVDPGFKEDRWISAAQVLPGNRRVVHHSVIFIRPPDERSLKGIGWLTAYVPGQGQPFYDPRYARRIPAGSKLVFQQHYTPTGQPETDVTRIGLVFADPSKITHEVFTIAAMDQEFEIPPGDESFNVDARTRSLPLQNGELIGFAPHMHFRGKSFKAFAINGMSRRQLIDVPNYDFNWQHLYLLEERMPLSDVSSIECSFRFDNSNKNPFNPDPTESVTWGDQTWEEMAIAYFDVARPRNNAQTKQQGRAGDSFEQQAVAFADRYLEKFDANGDGVIERGETPHAVRHFRFNRFDLDSNNRISRSELKSAALERLKNRQQFGQ